MQQYIDLAKKILDTGIRKTDRTGTGTISLIGESLKFDLFDGFPILTTKKMGLKNIFTELQFFLRGETNIKWLQDRGCNIWNSWGYSGSNKNIEQGYLGPVYGEMWNRWEEIKLFDIEQGNDLVDTTKILPEGYEYIGETYDNTKHKNRIVARRYINQLQRIYEALENRSNSRRLIVSGWNPALLPDESKSHNENIESGLQVLPPCHTLWQLIVEPSTDYDMATPYLNLVLYQRSADYGIGVPYNIASYALLLELLSSKFGYIAKNLVIHFGDVHIYSNQIDVIKEQIKREPKPLPFLMTNDEKAESFLDFDILSEPLDSLFCLEGYDPHDALIYPPAAV